MKKIILASTSPRRKEILEKTGLNFKIVSSDYEEDMTLDLKPLELAKFLSERKAETVAKRYKNHIIIAADTFVALRKEALGKPHTEIEALKMLRKISGKTLSVITGFTVLDTKTGKGLSKSVETKVSIKKLSEKEMRSYVNTKEPLDKAGAFAIQGIGAVLIKKIEGDFLGAMGLPLYEISEALKKFDVNILN